VVLVESQSCSPLVKGLAGSINDLQSFQARRDRLIDEVEPGDSRLLCSTTRIPDSQLAQPSGTDSRVAAFERALHVVKLGVAAQRDVDRALQFVGGKLKTEPIFYGTFLAVTATAAILVMIPGAPLIPILFLTQALNAVMLLPLLAMIIHLCRDQKMMGTLKIGRVATALSWTTFAMIAAAIVALGAYSLP